MIYSVLSDRLGNILFEIAAKHAAFFVKLAVQNALLPVKSDL